jgi:membrane protein DedA with SNARE-associated domain
MITILGFIQTYGYASIFFFTLLEGEVVVALAGFLASEGVLSLPLVILTAIVGAIVGDHAYFFFGRYKGKQFIDARPTLAQRVSKIHLLIERHQDWLIFGSRFMYGFRTILPIAIGTSNVRLLRFSFFNTLGSITWGLFFSIGRYAFGSAIQQFLGNVRRAEKFIIVGVIVGVALVQLILFFRRRVVSRIEAVEAGLESELQGKE